MPTATFDENTGQHSGEAMRILHLIKHCQHCNGNVNVAVDLACGQARKGHLVVFASAGGHYDSLLDAWGVRRVEIRQGQGSNPFVLAGNLAALVRLCRRFKPDVIHAHMMSSAVFGFLASKITGVPLVTTVHNSFDRHAVLMRAGRVVVAVSKAERDFLVGRGFKPGQIVVILNGPNGSPRESFGTPTGVVLATPSITTVCGLHPRKGVHDLLAAFHLLLPEFPNWHFNIIGNGPDRAKLEALAVELGISGSTHFLGAVEAPQPLLRQSQIFVLASHAEPCCLAIPEAREAGCAIVATAVGGTPELLGHGDAGQLVEPGKPDQFVKALRGLMQDEDALRQWRTRAKTGASYFTVDRVVEDYDKVYAALKHA
jgi:glycosyltransferase involved in cell wall biosynthesis